MFMVVSGEFFDDVAVEIGERSGAGGPLGEGEEFIGPCLLFDLLADEPVEQHGRWVVLHLQRGFITTVDAFGVFSFEIAGMAGDRDKIGEILLRCGHRGENRSDATIQQMIVEFPRVLGFLAGLLAEEFGEAGEIRGLAPKRKRKIGGGGEAFVFGLVLQGGDDGWIRHGVLGI